MIKANSRTSITSSLTKNFRVLQVLFKDTWTLVHLGPSVNRPTKVLKRTFVGSESNFRCMTNSYSEDNFDKQTSTPISLSKASDTLQRSMSHVFSSVVMRHFVLDTSVNTSIRLTI